MTDASSVLSSVSPVGRVQGVVDEFGSAMCEAVDQTSELGRAERDDTGGSVSAFPASTSRTRPMVRQAWAAMAKVTWRCQPGWRRTW